MAQQHYRFAYTFLKGFAFQRTEVLRNALRSDADEFLSWLWAQSAVGESAPSTGLAVRTWQQGGRDLALVTMPAPQEPPEAYFVLIAFGPEEPDFFSLEMSDPEFGGSGTVLGKWRPECRYNLGEGVPAPPSEQAFLDSVLPQLGL
jgi:hypothetical protein